MTELNIFLAAVLIFILIIGGIAINSMKQEKKPK